MSEIKEYQLTKKIPIPNRYKFPFPKMQVGDSFWVRKKAGTIYTQGMSWCIKNKKKWKFTTKKEKRGTRIWRTK